MRFYYLLFATSFFDAVSTQYALSYGSDELNIGHSYIIENWGFLAFYLFRAILIPLIVSLVIQYPFFKKYDQSILFVFCVVYTTAAIFNILQILIYG